MAINLDKSEAEKKYYYSDNGNTLGPFSITQILDKINGDTLVYRDGIDWTAAKNLTEFSKFFPKEKIVEKVVVKEKIVEVGKSSSNEIKASLYRSNDSKILFGFCGGLAHKFSVNVVFIRVLLIFSFFMWIGWLYFFTFLLPAYNTKNL
jgi:phage shock protein PspC (stress-responsive transcriptional regulator)